MSSRWRLLPRNETLGWTPYAWLIYLPVFLADPISASRAGAAPAWLWPATILGLIVFLVSYFLGYWPPRRRLLYIALLQTALGVIFAPINTGSAVFFVYGASFAAMMDNGRRALQMVLLIALIGVIASLITKAPFYFWITAVGVVLLVGGVNLHFAQVARSQRKLQLAQDEVEHLAAVAERERIARDLHDVLGHTLSLIILKSELASKLADREPARAAREIRDVESVARQALQEVRAAIRGYRATLAEEVERARALLKAADIDAHFDMAAPELSRPHAETLALALREAVTNVVRHARAQRCTVAVLGNGTHVILHVSDDGAGSGLAEGTGLRGMRERIEALGGTLERSSERGVRLTVRLPMPAAPLASSPVLETGPES
ncbi:MAG: sensor histidine kinase [Longimicrobiales bacterium]